MLYIVSNSYQPNTAPTNRLLSFLRGFSELGINVTLVFVEPDSNYSRLGEVYSNVTIKYLWDDIKIKSRIVSKFASHYYGWKFTRSLKADDIVILMSAGYLFFNLINTKSIKFYHERTEHPDVYKIRGFNKKEYKRRIKDLDGLFVISTSLKDYFASLGLNSDKIHVINMTVDSNRFTGLCRQPSAYKYIAYCGTASNNKDGVDELIKSFAIVHSLYPDIKLVIIGKTPDATDRSGNIQLIKSLNLEDSIVFTGVVTADEMPQLLKNADILALDRPNSLQARCGFPTKLGEYLLTENVVVVTKVGDIPLFLEDGKTALLAEERNPDDFASKIIWALSNPEAAAIIGKAGAKVAMEKFNYLTETKKILKVIQYH
ncbi:MAG: glycosyltransferase family 4 protein [Bacteroidales bacterium]|nr:glycosyltransferase family 4 protein [Bacteroidales bacterium]